MDPEPIWTGAENLSPTGIRSPDRPARSESLYRLSYPSPLTYIVNDVQNSTQIFIFFPVFRNSESISQCPTMPPATFTRRTRGHCLGTLREIFLFLFEIHAVFLTKHPLSQIPHLLLSFSSFSSDAACLHISTRKHTWKLTVAQAFNDVMLKTKYNTPKLHTHVQAFLSTLCLQS